MYYTGIALTVSTRSTCLRSRYGVVIVKNDEIVSTGYNGTPRACSNCSDLGYCLKDRYGAPHGSGYESCPSAHAEWNALISASRRDVHGGDLYLAGTRYLNHELLDAKPCILCRRMIINAGLLNVYVLNSEGEVISWPFLQESLMLERDQDQDPSPLVRKNTEKDGIVSSKKENQNAKSQSDDDASCYTCTVERYR
jgi:dCMP deaminase